MHRRLPPAAQRSRHVPHTHLLSRPHRPSARRAHRARQRLRARVMRRGRHRQLSVLRRQHFAPERLGLWARLACTSEHRRARLSGLRPLRHSFRRRPASRQLLSPGQRHRHHAEIGDHLTADPRPPGATHPRATRPQPPRLTRGQHLAVLHPTLREPLLRGGGNRDLLARQRPIRLRAGLYHLGLMPSPASREEKPRRSAGFL